ncbi:MAG: hypothetical protein SGJ20_18745, partial [Planctomycetota bacterium]|nr:hypothetical protein [Planctomycetota bacterium]
AQQITLDIACRVRDIATAEWLGSRYRSLVGAKWNELIAVEARSNSGLLPEENGVTLQPTNFKEILQVPGKAATICWCYVLRASAES